MGRVTLWKSLTIIIATILLLSGCSGQPAAKKETTPKSRLESIPITAVKQSPSSDRLPSQLHSSEFQSPVPVDSTINTAGAEDSAFVTPDGNSLYFFFTPDGNIPAEKQLTDGMTGIYLARRVGGQWQPAERVLLQKANDVALDGCVLVQGNQM